MHWINRLISEFNRVVSFKSLTVVAFSGKTCFSQGDARGHITGGRKIKSSRLDLFQAQLYTGEANGAFIGSFESFMQGFSRPSSLRERGIFKQSKSCRLHLLFLSLLFLSKIDTNNDRSSADYLQGPATGTSPLVCADLCEGHCRAELSTDRTQDRRQQRQTRLFLQVDFSRIYSTKHEVYGSKNF